jgi:hypothetical protein
MLAPKINNPQTKAREATSRLALERRTHAGHGYGRAPTEQAVFPQRTIGNQATLQLLAQRALRPDRETGFGNTETSTEGRAISRDFSAIPTLSPERGSQAQPSFSPHAARFAGAIQAKLQVGALDDPLEREADQVAERVMSMPSPIPALTTASAASRSAASGLQGQCQCGGKCTDCDNKMPKTELNALRRKAAFATPAGALAAPPAVHRVLSSSGSPLDGVSRAFMEPRFGMDFSKVRTHSGAAAVEAARLTNSKAFTVGHHIVFGEEQASSTSNTGRQLLAHELTHVVQQCGKEQMGNTIGLFFDPLLMRSPSSKIAVGRMSYQQIEARAKKIFVDALTALRKEQGKEVTEAYLGRMNTELTVDVIQGIQDGKVVTYVNPNVKEVRDTGKFDSYIKDALEPGEQFLESGLTGHAESVGARALAQRGVTDALVGTSNKGCAFCVREIDEIPGFTHISPRVASRGLVNPSGSVARPVTTATYQRLTPGKKYRSKTPPRDNRVAVGTEGEIIAVDHQPSAGTKGAGNGNSEPTVEVMAENQAADRSAARVSGTGREIAGTERGLASQPGAAGVAAATGDSVSATGAAEDVMSATTEVTGKAANEVTGKAANIAAGAAEEGGAKLALRGGLKAIAPLIEGIGIVSDLILLKDLAYDWLTYSKNAGPDSEPAIRFKIVGLFQSVEPAIQAVLKARAPEALALRMVDPEFPIYANISLDLDQIWEVDLEVFNSDDPPPQALVGVSFIGLTIERAQQHKDQKLWHITQDTAKRNGMLSLLPAELKRKHMVRTRKTYPAEITFGETREQREELALLFHATKAVQRHQSARLIEGSHLGETPTLKEDEKYNRTRWYTQPSLQDTRDLEARKRYVRLYIWWTEENGPADLHRDAVKYLQELETPRRVGQPMTGANVRPGMTKPQL